MRDEHDTTPLLRAVLGRCPTELVRALIDAGADVNIKTKTGVSVLALAEMYGRDDLVELLQKGGAR